MSGNAVFTSCSKGRGRLQSVGWRESSCRGYYIIHGLAAFFQLCKAWLALSLGSHRQPRKQKADSLGGEGGLKSLLWVPAGRGERQIVQTLAAPVTVVSSVLPNYRAMQVSGWNFWLLLAWTCGLIQWFKLFTSTTTNEYIAILAGIAWYKSWCVWSQLWGFKDWFMLLR